MNNEYRIDKTNNGYELLRIYTKEDNSKGSIKVAQFTDIVEFNNFIENSTTKRLNEFFKEHHIGQPII